MPSFNYGIGCYSFIVVVTVKQIQIIKIKEKDALDK